MLGFGTKTKEECFDKYCLIERDIQDDMALIKNESKKAKAMALIKQIQEKRASLKESKTEFMNDFKQIFEEYKELSDMPNDKPAGAANLGIGGRRRPAQENIYNENYRTDQSPDAWMTKLINDHKNYWAARQEEERMREEEAGPSDPSRLNIVTKMSSSRVVPEDRIPLPPPIKIKKNVKARVKEERSKCREQSLVYDTKTKKCRERKKPTRTGPKHIRFDDDGNAIVKKSTKAKKKPTHIRFDDDGNYPKRALSQGAKKYAKQFSSKKKGQLNEGLQIWNEVLQEWRAKDKDNKGIPKTGTKAHRELREEYEKRVSGNPAVQNIGITAKRKNCRKQKKVYDMETKKCRQPKKRQLNEKMKIWNELVQNHLKEKKKLNEPVTIPKKGTEEYEMLRTKYDAMTN